MEDRFIHESEKCLILGAKDHGAVESYGSLFLSYRKKDIDEDIDDLQSQTEGSIVHSPSFNVEENILNFIKFGSKIGLDEETARLEYEKLAAKNSGGKNESPKGPKLEDFRDFCDNHGIHTNGTRLVVLKFIKDRAHYLREKEIRSKMRASQSDTCVCPLLNDYDIDRLRHSNEIEGNEDRFNLGLLKAHEGSWDLPHNNKDALFADDIKDKASNHRLAAFKYAVVLRKGDRNLSEMMYHEKNGILEVREHLSRIGNSLHELHNRGNSQFLHFIMGF